MGCVINRILLFLWFLIWPFTAVWRALYNYADGRDKKISFLLFFVFCGLCGYVLNVPYDSDMDLMRIYNEYDILKGMSFSDSLPYALSIGDLSYLVFWLLGRFDFPAQIIGFLSAGWFCAGWLLVISVLCRELLQTEKCPILFLALGFFLFATYPLFFSGVRSASGTIFVMLGLLHLFCGRNGLSLFFIVLASLFHFSFVTLLVLWLIFVTDKRRIYIIGIVCLLAGSVMYMFLMETVLGLVNGMGVLGDALARKIQYYVFEYDSSVKYSFVITYGSGWRFFADLLLIGGMLFVSQISAVKKLVAGNCFLRRLEWFIWLFIAFLFFVSSNETMLGRFFMILVYLCIVYLLAVLLLQSHSNNLKNVIYVLFLCCIGLSLMGFYREFQTGGDISYQYGWKILFCDVFSILSTVIDYKN